MNERNITHPKELRSEEDALVEIYTGLLGNSLTAEEIQQKAGATAQRLKEKRDNQPSKSISKLSTADIEELGKITTKFSTQIEEEE